MKKIYVWGTGLILARILDYRIKLDEIEAFVDNDGSKTEYMNKRVIRPVEIESDCDAVIVANIHTSEIAKQCNDLNIDLKKVIFLYNNIETKDINGDYSFIADILGEEYANIIRDRYHMVRNISKDEVIGAFDNRLYQTPMYHDDYVRVKSLELVADEIYKNNVPGDVAELGVFKGEFARCINILFPDRKMYLYDTFDGFENKEAVNEKSNGSCNDVFIDAFKNVAVEQVLSKMVYKDNVILRQGIFPKSVYSDNLLRFAFVSLDVDFEESTYNGLECFYPRLSKGGYIFIHDYNYGYFDCVKNAVAKYEQTYNIRLCKVPICDAIGTLVVTK